jgi:hypothetical protein
LLKMLRRIFDSLGNLRLFEKLILQGLFLTVVLVGVQMELDSVKTSFMSYMPPIGFGFFMVISYLIQPLLIGVLNIVIINFFYKTKGWQVGFWLNGIFLLLVFTTINVVLEVSFALPFAPIVAVVDILAFSLPFGCIARFSNGGWNKPID